MSREISSAPKPLLPNAVDRCVGRVRFDAIMAILSAWMVVGLYIDGWSHRHISGLESFFTPWHLVFYSGYLAIVLFTSGVVLEGMRRGVPWRQILPQGYGETAVGLVVFGAGGIADMVWHELFGFELSVEALVSPSHLLVFTGLGLIVSGPLRAAWHRVDENSTPSIRQEFPLLLSLALLWSVLTFATMVLHPFMGAHAGSKAWTHVASFGEPTLDIARSAGIAGIVLQTAIMMGLLLLAVGRWRLPFGGLTLILTCNVALVSLLDEQYALILVALLAGVGADLLLWLLQPSAKRVGAYRLFASAVPLLVYLGYFLCLKAKEGLGWSIHMVTGSIVLAGLTGCLLSYLMIPPSVVQPRR